MNIMLLKNTAALAGLAALLLASSAQAQQVTISPTSVVTSALVGQTLTFSASVTNNTGGALTIAFDNLDFNPSQPGPTEVGPSSSPLTVALDDTPFFSGAYPYTFTTGQTQTIPLYALEVGSGATFGTYSGYFQLQDGSGNDLSGGLQTFNLTVGTPAPEPSSLISVGVGAMLLAGCLAVRRRRAYAPVA